MTDNFVNERVLIYKKKLTKKISSSDVIHSCRVPHLGVKCPPCPISGLDAYPARLNQYLFMVQDKVSIMCSVLSWDMWYITQFYAYSCRVGI